jgi:hypothetical protein
VDCNTYIDETTKKLTNVDECKVLYHHNGFSGDMFRGEDGKWSVMYQTEKDGRYSIMGAGSLLGCIMFCDRIADE